jgi:putative ABC transport system ATP-binding protein
MGVVVELEGVAKRYPEGDTERTVLEDVTFSLQAGELAVLLGRSGSGKSTLLNLISGMDTASRGQLRIQGQRMSSLSETERTLFRRRSMGFVFQAFNLIPTLTVEENVRFPLELNGQPAAVSATRALELLETLGLADRRQTFPDRLSGGEQQRVAIARALVHSPALILADEPTGNLDDVTGQKVFELLETLARQAGSTVLVVTHDLRWAERADRVLRLEGGRLR